MYQTRAKYIGEVVKRVRKSLGISQDEFADRVEISPRYYQDLELGKRNLTLTTLEKIVNSSPVFHNGHRRLREIIPEPDTSGLTIDSLLNSPLFKDFDKLSVPLQVISKNGKYIYLNTPNVALFSAPISPIVENSYCFDYLSSEAEKRHLVSYLDFLCEKKPPSKPYYCSVQAPDGFITHVTADWSYLRDEAGSIAGFLTTCCILL